MAEAATSPKAAEKAVAAGQKNKKAVSSKEEHEEEHEDASDASNEAEEEEDDVDHSEGQGVYQQVLKDKDNSDEFVGCMPTGFAFNEPEGYNRVRTIINCSILVCSYYLWQTTLLFSDLPLFISIGSFLNPY